MKRIVRLTESDLTRIVRRVISEQEQTKTGPFAQTIDWNNWGGDPLNDTVFFKTTEGYTYRYNCKDNKFWNKSMTKPLDSPEWHYGFTEADKIKLKTRCPKKL